MNSVLAWALSLLLRYSVHSSESGIIQKPGRCFHPNPGDASPIDSPSVCLYQVRDDCILVGAIMHLKRDPTRWQQRVVEAFGEQTSS